jgi:lysophospholipase L1-like esterase
MNRWEETVRMGVPMKRFWQILTLGALLASSYRSNGQEMMLHDGDRVVFYGDSITAQRLYTRFVEDFVLTRYPQLHVAFWNAGVPGDTVNGGYTGDIAARLARDVFPHRPTVLTVMLGMNDGYYMPFNEQYLGIYKDGYRKLLSTLAAGAPGSRITVISPTPYDEVTHGTEFAHYDEVVSRHAAFDKDLATSAQCRFSDLNQAETALLAAGMRENPSFAKLLVPDRIHPAEASHWLMAATLAKSWGLSPIVSSVTIDASHTKVKASQNSHLENLAVKNGKLQWTQTDDALPLPLNLEDPMIKFVLSVSDLAAMDQQTLRVEGLPAANYGLKIDDRVVASFNRAQLSAGVNLAPYSTPMQSQAKEVDGLEQKRAQLDETNFILAIEKPQVDGIDGATEVLRAKDEELAKQQRKSAQPKPHRFELVPE